MKYNDNGTYKDIYVKTFDTLPVGAEVDYDGETAPAGWVQVPSTTNNIIEDYVGTGSGQNTKTYTGLLNTNSTTIIVSALYNQNNYCYKIYVYNSNRGEIAPILSQQAGSVDLAITANSANNTVNVTNVGSYEIYFNLIIY